MKLTLADTKFLKESVSIIAELVTEVRFNVGSNGLELIAMDPFHDKYSNKPYILANPQRMSNVNMEADILIWNNTHGLHGSGYSNFHGVSRLSMKLKLRDNAQTEIGTF